MSKKQTINNMSYAEAIAELTKISEYLEREDIDLDTAVQEFERGNELISYLKEYLKNTENKVENIKIDLASK